MLTLSKVLLLVCLACALPAQLSAKPPKPKPAATDDALPPPLEKYKGREIAQTMHFTGAEWLVRDSREREEDCSTLLKVLDAQPGQVVCDFGCGNGFYTMPLAGSVGEQGRVLAVDIQPEMLTLLRERSKEANVKNIELIHCTPVDPGLPAGELDLVILVDVYHELSYPEQVLEGIRDSLKPDGAMVLVEFRKEDRDVPIKVEHKMSKRQIMKELEPNGFKLVKQFDDLPWQHVMFFARDDSDLPAVEPTTKFRTTKSKPKGSSE